MELIIAPDMTVDQVLKAEPRLMTVFQKYGTDCVGCLLTRFCNLEDVSVAYNLDLDTFINELSTAIKTQNRSEV